MFYQNYQIFSSPMSVLVATVKPFQLLSCQAQVNIHIYITRTKLCIVCLSGCFSVRGIEGSYFENGASSLEIAVSKLRVQTEDVIRRTDPENDQIKELLEAVALCVCVCLCILS